MKCQWSDDNPNGPGFIHCTAEGVISVECYGLLCTEHAAAAEIESAQMERNSKAGTVKAAQHTFDSDGSDAGGLVERWIAALAAPAYVRWNVQSLN